MVVTQHLVERITIRRCKGNRSAWAATIGPSEWLASTGLSLGRLAERMRERYPRCEIVIEGDAK